MTWSRFDDGYDEHEKIEDAWFAFPPNPVGLHAMATTACNRWLSDGVVRPRWLQKMLPKDKDRQQILGYMVRAVLFDVLGAGETIDAVDQSGNATTIGPFDEPRYVVHDFLKRHDCATTIKAKRAKDAERKARARRPDSAGSPDGVRADSTGTPNGRRAESVGSPPHAPAGAPTPASRPDPTRPLDPPGPPEGGRRRDQAAFGQSVQVYAGALYPSPAAGHGAAVTAIKQAIDRGARTELDVRTHIERWFPLVAVTEQQAMAIASSDADDGALAAEIGISEQTVHIVRTKLNRERAAA